MSTENRRWTAAGLQVRGTAPGKPDLVWSVAPFPTTPGDVDELHEVAVKMAAYLNGMLSTNDQSVLEAVLAHQAISEFPASAREISLITGLHRKTVHEAFDRLAAAGLGTRPPQGLGGLRPFRAITPETANQ